MNWRTLKLRPLLAFLAIPWMCSAAPSSLHSNFHHAWSQNAGWFNLRPGQPAGDGVRVSVLTLSGMGWGQNIGWIDFGDGTPSDGLQYTNTNASDCGVNLDWRGDLSGYAWSQNAGWINFGWANAINPDRPRLNQSTNSFTGVAWSQNLGWIKLGDGWLRNSGPPLPYVDEDADGIPDTFEMAVNGNLTDYAHATDSDSDGLSDAWEFSHFHLLTFSDGLADTDGDGWSDAVEYRAGTSPTNASNPLLWPLPARDSSLSSGASFAWAQNLGWLNARHNQPTNPTGIVATEYYLFGTAWLQNAGWINVGDGTPRNGISYSNASANDYGVNVDGDNNLSGYAWAQNIGWINFGWAASDDPDRPRLENSVSSHRFLGRAWTQNAGWLDLSLLEHQGLRAVQDGDHDGLPDQWEFALAASISVLNGASLDVDGDGLLDAWEFRFFRSLTRVDGAGDFDGDGRSDSAELALGSDPRDPLSPAPPCSLEVDGSRVGLSTDLNSTPAGPSQGFTLSDGKLYFLAMDATLGSVIRRVTEAGSEVVVDINPPGGADPNLGNLTDLNGVLYFTADDGVHGNELWRLGVAGAEMVADVNLGSEGSWPGNLTVVNGVLYFTATDAAQGAELWHLAGGALPAVTDVVAGVDGSYPSNLKGVGNRLFFTASTDATGEEFWYLDATYAALLVENDAVADGGIRSGADAIFPSNLFVLGEALYAVLGTTPFGAGDKEIWRVRTSASAVSLAELVFTSTAPPGPFSFGPPVEFAAVGTELYFTGNSAATGSEIWRIPTPTAAAVLAAEVVAGADGSFPHELIDVNGVLYFTADDGVNGVELWRKTATGAEMVEDAIPGGGINPTDSAYPTHLTMAGGKLYFGANDGTHGNQLWRLGIDGNVASFGGSVEFLQSVVSVNDRLYFVAGGLNGDVLWTLNSQDVPVQVATDGFALNPAYLTDYQGQLIWLTNDGVHGQGLWRMGQVVPTLTVLEDAPASNSGFLGNAGGGAGFTITASWRGGVPATDVASFGTVTFHAGSGTWTWNKPSVLLTENGDVTITASDASGNCSVGSFHLVVVPRLPEIVVEYPTNTALESGVSTVDFGTAGQGFLHANDFTIRNTGTRQLTISAVNITGDFALSGSPPSLASPWIIPPGSSRLITMSMIQNHDGTKLGSLSLVNDDADEAPFVISLTGVIEAPNLALFGATGVPEIFDAQAEAVDFGRAAVAPIVKRFMARNTGHQELQITAASLPPGFTLLTPALPVTLPVGGSQLVQVRYLPSAIGTVAGNVIFTTNDLGNPQFAFPVQVVVGPPCDDLNFEREIVPLPGLPDYGDGVVMGDVTGDGHEDILTIQRFSDAPYARLMVLEGDGVGHFAFEGQMISVPANSEIMHLADFNRDGRQDIVLTPYQHSAPVSIMLQQVETGVGSPIARFGFFAGSTVTQLGLSSHVAVGDYDRDGNADIMIANETSHQMGLVRGDGHGHFSDLQPETPIATAKYPAVLVAEDFNLDGKADLGVVCRIGGTEDFPPASDPPVPFAYQNGQLFNYQGDGAGNFTAGGANPVGPWATALATADFNSDGFPDMVTGSMEGIISVRLGDGTGSFASAANIVLPNAATTSVGELKTGDFNGDSVPDILSLSFQYLPNGTITPHVGVHLSNGDGTFTTGTWFTPERYAKHITVGDFDHDGVSDFAVVAEHLWLYRNFSCYPSVIRVTHRDPLVDGVSSVSMGSTAVDTDVFTLFLIYNDGKHDLTGITATIDGQPDFTFRIAGPPATYVPGKFELPNPQFTQVRVAFRPRSTGTKTAVLHIASNDPDNNPFDIVLTGTGTQNYDGWTGEYLLEGPPASPAGNPTGDGISNLVKYAFNLNPLTAGAREITPGTGLSGLPHIASAVSGPGTVFRYEYIRRRGGGLVYTPEISTNLTGWAGLSSEPTVTLIDDTWERVVHEEPVPPTITRQFGRVTVLLPVLP